MMQQRNPNPHRYSGIRPVGCPIVRQRNPNPHRYKGSRPIACPEGTLGGANAHKYRWSRPVGCPIQKNVDFLLILSPATPPPRKPPKMSIL